MNDLPDSHDALVEEIVADWEKGTLLVRLASSIGGVVLRASGLRRFLMPREQPWGPCVYVNEASAAPITHGTQLMIEMQSGDCWEIEAKAFEVGVSAANGPNHRLP
jgi:hypothetical protein